MNAKLASCYLLHETKQLNGLYMFQSGQDVPDWLEEIAMSAIGTNYGPGGGQFSSRDTRVIIFL